MAITKEMTIQQIVGDNPDTVRVFFKHGLMCVGCAAARFESLEQGARAHGIDIDSLVADLNAHVEGVQAQA
jgi:hybrid cluster-associated redox disulfide protein